jgi:hypothetical protein
MPLEWAAQHHPLHPVHSTTMITACGVMCATPPSRQVARHARAGLPLLLLVHAATAAATQIVLLTAAAAAAAAAADAIVNNYIV